MNSPIPAPHPTTPSRRRGEATPFESRSPAGLTGALPRTRPCDRPRRGLPTAGSGHGPIHSRPARPCGLEWSRDRCPPRPCEGVLTFPRHSRGKAIALSQNSGLRGRRGKARNSGEEGLRDFPCGIRTDAGPFRRSGPSSPGSSGGALPIPKFRLRIAPSRDGETLHRREASTRSHQQGNSARSRGVAVGRDSAPPPDSGDEIQRVVYFKTFGSPCQTRAAEASSVFMGWPSERHGPAPHDDHRRTDPQDPPPYPPCPR